NGGGVFKSEDGGGSWTAVNNGLINLNVQTIAIDSVDTDVIYAGTDAGSLFISTDGGGSWSDITGSISGANVLSLAVDPDTTTTLYAGTAGEGFFKLTERGEPTKTEGSGGGCFIESAAYDSPVSRQVQPGQVVATSVVIFVSVIILSIALFYLLRKLRFHGVVFEVSKVKRRFSHGMPILRR
ncbi:MAG: hypothetical protein LJE89_11845, partial [Deltaproteobacteria bacterium]|nr:hypothetical protein [Deltaproteobacteria bacterium]